jgi:cobalt/nickel transport system ATP-binding protein
MNDAPNHNFVCLEGVSFSYPPNRIVLSDCDLLLNRSERIGLTGSNGSGKSTLLGLIVGLLRPTAGRVEIFGKVRSRENDFHEVRQRVGLLFQDSENQLFCPTVAEDVAFGPLNLGKPREEVRCIVAETLDALGLGGYEDRITYKLSGGEKRLVALATVLAMEPEVLLLDEPTSGLDDDAVKRLMGVLSRLPHAMVIATHDERLLGHLATKRLKLAGGQLKPIAQHAGFGD